MRECPNCGKKMEKISQNIIHCFGCDVTYHKQPWRKHHPWKLLETNLEATERNWKETQFNSEKKESVKE